MYSRFKVLQGLAVLFHKLGQNEKLESKDFIPVIFLLIGIIAAFYILYVIWEQIKKLWK
jgi:hypothetical protein